MLRIDQSIKDASEILRQLNEEADDADVEGDFGEYNNNNIMTIGTKSKQLGGKENTGGSHKKQKGNIGEEGDAGGSHPNDGNSSNLSLKFVREGQSINSQNQKSLNFDNGDNVENNKGRT